MGNYKIIDGIRYEQELLHLAEGHSTCKGESNLNYDEVKALMNSALDGKRITHTERRTLHYIYDNFKLTDEAREYMIAQLFRLKDNVHYDLVLIDAAELAIEGRGDGRISMDDAELIWSMVESDGKITDVERRTIGYIIEAYNCTEPATAFLRYKNS